jgi:hypothetical protein
VVKQRRTNAEVEAGVLTPRLALDRLRKLKNMEAKGLLIPGSLRKPSIVSSEVISDGECVQT